VGSVQKDVLDMLHTQKLEVSHTKQTELEEENWGGQDLNMGRSTKRKGEGRRENYIGYINSIHKHRFTVTPYVRTDTFQPTPTFLSWVLI